MSPGRGITIKEMRPLFCFVAVSALFGQVQTDLFHKAPPAVDEALRARINKFYQLQVEGNYRAAEALVAEDTKDYYYNSGKPKYFGFKINRIDYNDDFTAAKVVVTGQRIIAMPGLTSEPRPFPEGSKWKLVNGDWYWYLTDEDQHMTPMGLSHPTASGQTPQIPGQEEMQKVLTQVTADKKEVTLKSEEESRAEFVISNPLSGAITLTLEAPADPKGAFAAQLDHAEVAPGGKATVTVSWKPGIRPAPQLIQIVARAEPINVVVRMRVKFEQ